MKAGGCSCLKQRYNELVVVMQTVLTLPQYTHFLEFLQRFCIFLSPICSHKVIPLSPSSLWHWIFSLYAGFSQIREVSYITAIEPCFDLQLPLMKSPMSYVLPKIISIARIAGMSRIVRGCAKCAAPTSTLSSLQLFLYRNADYLTPAPTYLPIVGSKRRRRQISQKWEANGQWTYGQREMWAVEHARSARHGIDVGRRLNYLTLYLDSEDRISRKWKLLKAWRERCDT